MLLQYSDMLKIKDKFNMTQKLLGKIDKELESHKTSKQIDSPKFLELINKTFQTYELCAQEFCFELEILQFTFVSVFFKQYIQGYHNLINNLMKFSLEKINNAPKIQNNARKGSISDSSKDSSPAQKKEKNNTSFDNKKYSKDDIKEKFQKMSASKDDDHSFNLLPPPNISGRSAGVDNNSNQDRKNYTIQLLRAELLKQQTHSQTLSHKLNDAIKELDQTHLAKNNLEEEIIRLVKFEKNQQDNATRQSFVDDKNIKKNRVAGGFDAKAIKGKNTDKNQKKELKRTSAINTIVDTDDITEYLKSIENKKKAPEKVKNNDEYPIDESYKRAPIMKEEIENEKEKKDFDDITMFLQNRDKTFAQIKESGATKELKQYLRKMATQKKDFSKMNNEALNEFDEVFDSDSPELATEKIKNDNSTHKKNVGRKFNAKNSEKNKVIEVFSSVEKIRIDKGTMPDPLIFDIQIIEAIKFTNENLKKQVLKLEEEAAGMQMEIKRLDDELNKSKSVFSDEKRRILEGNSLQEIFNFERITLKTQITSLQLDKDALEKKIKSKKAKINFFKSELKNTNSKEPETNISKLKVENIELKLNNEKNNAEIKTLKIKVETLLAEIEKLGKQLIDTTEDFLKSQEEYDNLNLKLNLLQEGFSSANIQINLLDEKNTMLEEILNSLEEGKKKLQDLKNSVNFQKNTSSLQKNKEGIAKSFKDLNEFPQKMNELKKIIDKNRNESNKISLESISDFHNESYENEIESSQNFNKKKIEKNYSQDNIENMKKNSANRGISNKLKESGFKKMDSSKDVGLPTEYAKINDKNFKKNDEKIINHEKIINNLENKLQNEIIQKEKFLQQNQMLEQTIILLKQAKGIPNGDQIKDSEIKQNSQIIKNKKNNLPPLNEEKMKNVSEILYEKNNSKTTEPLNKTSETNFKNKLKKEINNINKTEDINKFISENPYNLQNDINKTTINCNNNENNGVKNNENSPLLKKNSLTCHITNLDKNDNPVNSNNENHPHGKINDKTENLQKNLPQNDFFSNKSNLVSDNFLAFDINSQKYLSKKNYNLANNKYTLNNQYPSQQSLYKADKILNSEHSVFDTFTSEESLINPSSLKNLELFPNKKRNIRREEENKKENEKMNIMYENLQDLIKIEGSNLMKVSPPELSKFFQKLSERKKDNVVNALGNDEKILIENEHLNLRIEEFKEVINEIKSEHRRCGPTCIHLKRFYEKLGFSEKKLGKKLYHLHKRIINKLPKIE